MIANSPTITFLFPMDRFMASSFRFTDKSFPLDGGSIREEFLRVKKEYYRKAPGHDRMIREIRLQNTGIAMCYFELSSKERLTGDWESHDWIR